MGTFSTSPFSYDGGLDFLGQVAHQPLSQRREVLERIFFQVQDRLYLLGWKVLPAAVVAAAAIVAAGLPGGESIRQELAYLGYDADAILPGGADPQLSSSALEALLLTVRRDGPWHDDWTNAQAAARARQPLDQLAAIFLRKQHSGDQELPLRF